MRRELLRDPPAVLVQCMDAHALKQSLALTADLAGLGLPLSSSSARPWRRGRRGRSWTWPSLERLLGCPVVESPSPGQGDRRAPRRALQGPTGRRARQSRHTAGGGASTGSRPLLPELLPFRRKIAELRPAPRRADRRRPRGCRSRVGRRAVARGGRTEAAAGLPESLARTAAARRDRWVDDVADRAVRRRGAPGRGFRGDLRPAEPPPGLGPADPRRRSSRSSTSRWCTSRAGSPRGSTGS